MPAAPIPANDGERLAALARYNILDTELEEIFERITLMAKSMFGTPIALISLVDSNRQWFKSHIGLDVCETSRDQAFCGYAILQSEPLVVEDATKDPRFADNPLVISEPNIRFYAGAQLVTHDGHALGTLCIIAYSPRTFLDVDVKLLKDLAKLAMNEIELKLIRATDQRVKEYSNRDKSTNQYNQRTFKRIFNAECQRANKHRGALSLAIMRLMNCDEIRKHHGEEAVEFAVKSVASTCKSIMRSSDFVARLSKDEFALMMPDTKSESAETVVRRLLRRVRTCEVEYSGRTFSCVVNIGVATKLANQRAPEFYKEVERNRCTADLNGTNTYVSSFAA